MGRPTLAEGAPGAAPLPALGPRSPREMRALAAAVRQCPSSRPWLRTNFWSRFAVSTSPV